MLRQEYHLAADAYHYGFCANRQSDDDALIVDISDGRTLSVPLA
jgi:hypothetical protein